jgi:hypothetical protein
MNAVKVDEALFEYDIVLPNLKLTGIVGHEYLKKKYEKTRKHKKPLDAQKIGLELYISLDKYTLKNNL